MKEYVDPKPVSECVPLQSDENRSIAALIEEYTPRLDDREWEPIAETVRSAVRHVEVLDDRRALSLMGAATAFVQWCHQRREHLTDELFEVERIEAFVAAKRVHGWSDSTCSTRRSELIAIADAVNGQTGSGRLRSLDRRVKAWPYTTAEVTALVRWVRRQAPEKRVDAGVLVGLGLGAGLTSREICAITEPDVIDGVGGLSVLVDGRVVPVVSRFEELIREALEVRNLGCRLFGGREVAGGKNFLSNFVAGCSKARPQVSTHRMRTTWMVGRLNAGVPIKELARAAGLDTLRTLNELLVWVESPDECEVDQLMRVDRRLWKAA